MLKFILKLRYVYLIAVFFSVLNSFAFLALGVYRSIMGYKAIVQLVGVENTTINPGLILAEALDSFLISFVFLIFGFGIYKIFVSDHTKESQLPPWLDIKSLSDLKILLWESLVITLLVFSVTVVIENIHELSWDLLLLPAIVFILTVGLVILRMDHHKKIAK